MTTGRSKWIEGSSIRQGLKQPLSPDVIASLSKHGLECGMTILNHSHNSTMLTVYPLLGTTCYVSFERLNSCNLRVDPGFVCMMRHLHGAMGWGTGYNPKSQFQMVANGEPVSALFQYEPEVKFGGVQFSTGYWLTYSAVFALVLLPNQSHTDFNFYCIVLIYTLSLLRCVCVWGGGGIKKGRRDF